MTAIRNRSRRHSSFIQYDEDPMNCYLPDGLFTYTETCNFVTYHPSCSESVFLFNYLSYFVCFMGFDSTWEGDMAVVAMFSLLIVFLWLIIYILTKFFILPNMLTVGRELNMMRFEFGLFLSIFLALPDMLYVLKVCTKVPESTTLLFAEGVGKALGCFCIGTVITSVKKPFRVSIWYFAVNAALMIGGIVGMMKLMQSKYQHEHKPGNPPPFQYKSYAFTFAGVYFLYIAIIVVVTRCSYALRSDRSSDASSSETDTPLTSTRTSEERDSYTDILWSALGYRMNNSIEPGVTANISPPTSMNPPMRANLSAHNNTHTEPVPPEPAKYMVCRLCLYSMFPFQYMPTYRWFQIFCAPIWFLVALFVPVIHTSRLLNGWCQPLVCLSYFVLPFCFLTVMPDTEQVLLTMTGMGGTFVLLILILTRPTKLPRCHTLLVLPGLVVASVIFFTIDKEVDVILMQMLSYVNDWELDAIAMVVYVFGYAVGEIIFCWELTSSGEQEASLGITYGLAMFSIYTTVPIMLLDPCPSESNTAVMTATTTTGCVFLLLVIGSTIFALFWTNFDMRFSFGIYTLFFFFVFVTYISLSQSHQIHPFGAQHASLILADNEPSTWT